MSSSSSAKRKRCNEIKKSLVEDIHDLVITSGNFRDEVIAPNEDLFAIYKSLADRQSEMYSQALGINEKYGGIVDLLKGNKRPRAGESSQALLELPPSYVGETRKFLDHTYTSLDNHAIQINEAIKEMINEFKKSGDVWNKKLSDIKDQAEEILYQRDKLRTQLFDFKKNICD